MNPSIFDIHPFICIIITSTENKRLISNSVLTHNTTYKARKVSSITSLYLYTIKEVGVGLVLYSNFEIHAPKIK
jgi:hypothetical protein